MKILIKGLDVFEQRILQTTVRLYEKRETDFALVTDSEIESADAIVIDAKDNAAMSWAQRNNSMLQQKVVVWIDGDAKIRRHAELKRPVLWVNLPIILSRILDDISVAEVSSDDRFLKREQKNPCLVPGTQDFHDGGESDKKTVLVVDDSLAIRNYLTSLLEKEGYLVKSAEDGEVALELVQSGDVFDCVFMDVLMPGIDGYAACRKIKGTKGGKKTPVIMLTGKGSAFDRIRGKMAGCSAYLVKPVSVQKLRETLIQFASED